MEQNTLSFILYDSVCVKLCIIHDFIFVSSIWIVVTIQWDLNIYDHDDPSILDHCIHTMDLRLPYDHFFIWMVVPIPWIFSHGPFYSDGCIHTVDSCFHIYDRDIRYPYVYTSLIYKSPEGACSHPFTSL